MKIALVLFVTLLFSATPAQSQPGPPTSQAPVQPASASPTETPPAPPQQPPAPQEQVQPQSEAQAATTSAPRTEGRWIQMDEYDWVWMPKAAKQPEADGQWVYTAQYGWLWMPYALRYVHEPSRPVEGAYLQTFVYHPTRGWTWVVAPWVWGWGVVPFYGPEGPWRFAWYRGPTFVHPGWGRDSYLGG